MAKSSTKSSRRLLYFAPKECWPPSTGGQLRNFYLARELAAAGEVVTYLGFSDERARAADQEGTYNFAGRNPVGEWCEKLVILPLETTYTPAKLAKGLIGRTPLPVLNYTTPPMQAALAKLLDESDYDLVHVQGLHLADYLPIIRAARSRPKVVCDWHNVESELMARYGERAGSVPKRAYASLTARRMARMEKRIVRQFDAHICVSERDQEQILALKPNAPIEVIENGVNVEYFSPKPNDPPARRHRIVFVGSMDYHANIDAVLHFAREVWPLVHAQLPELTFTVVGRNPTAEVAALAQESGIEVTGRVRDVRPYLREAFASVVPLRIGGGSRLKILEAMAAGVPLVSTALGAEGIDVRHGENLLLAEAPAEFAAAVTRLCRDEALQARLTEAGRKLVAAHYDWPAVVARLRELHEELLKN